MKWQESIERPCVKQHDLWADNVNKGEAPSWIAVGIAPFLTITTLL